MSGSGPQLRLVVSDGNARGMQISVEETFLIGRHAEAPGSLGGDPEISGRHAEIRLVGSGYFIEDLGSRHGTLLNGTAIATPRALGLGDRIEVGATTLVIQAITTPSAAATPESTSRLSLKLEIDARTGVGRLDLGEGTEPITLVYREGRWEVGE